MVSNCTKQICRIKVNSYAPAKSRVTFVFPAQSGMDKVTFDGDSGMKISERKYENIEFIF